MYEYCSMHHFHTYEQSLLVFILFSAIIVLCIIVDLIYCHFISLLGDNVAIQLCQIRNVILAFMCSVL